MPAIAAPARCCSTASRSAPAWCRSGNAPARAITTVEGLGEDGQAQRSAARVPRARRRAVRHLHARHADGGERPPGPQRQSVARRGRGCAGRRAVPLHRLSEDRRSGARRGAAGGGGARRQRRRQHRQGGRAGQADRHGALWRRRSSGGCALSARHPLAARLCALHGRRSRRVRRGAAGPRARVDGARCADQSLRHLSHHQGPAGAGRRPRALSRRSGGRVRRHARRDRSHSRRGRADHL